MKLLEDEIGPARELVFMDLEGAQLSHETIAIGACAYMCDQHLLPLKGHPVKFFKRYIKTDTRVGQVVTILTGITEQTLATEGISFDKAVAELIEVTKVPGGKRRYITFGNQDIAMLRVSALKDPTGKAMNFYNHIRKNWFDLQEFISRFVYDGKHITYSQPKLLEIFQAGDLKHAHDPLYDAENLMNLFKAVSTRSDILSSWFLRNVSTSKKTGAIIEPLIRRLERGETIDSKAFRAYLEDYFG